MTLSRKTRRASEKGIALLIAIFVLLLVCVIGIAMVVSSGTETALTGNYRSSTDSYYAALAGLEEGRGRLLAKNPNFINNTISGYIPASGTTMPLDKVLYITNPLPSETVDPTSGNPAYYADTEYVLEFPGVTPTVTTTPSVASSIAAGLQGPPYKWVRINPVTEKAINIDVNNGGGLNQVIPLYYDGTNINRTYTGNQIYEVSALAALPNGTRRLLQYVAAPVSLNLKFYSAVTMPGTGVRLNPPPPPPPPPAPQGYPFHINGYDQQKPFPTPACYAAPGALPKPGVPGVGVLNNSDESTMEAGMTFHPDQFTGYLSSPVFPSVSNLSPVPPPTPNSPIPPDQSAPSSLEALVQMIRQNADLVLPGPATASDLPSSMTPCSPQTIVIQGDPSNPSGGNLSLSGGAYTGYGVLVVTGDFTFTSDFSWYGVILVVGQGKVTVSGGGGSGEIQGAMFIAQTRDASGNQLTDAAGLGPANFTLDYPGGTGIYYNSYWIKNAQLPATYKILSFREIPQ